MAFRNNQANSATRSVKHNTIVVKTSILRNLPTSSFKREMLENLLPRTKISLAMSNKVDLCLRRYILKGCLVIILMDCPASNSESA